MIKADRLEKRLDKIERVLLRNTITLEDHTRRSLANEEAVKILREEIKPIQSHIYRVDGGLKLIGLISMILGLILAIVKLTGH